MAGELRRLKDDAAGKIKLTTEQRNKLLRIIAERQSAKTGRPIAAAISAFRAQLLKPELARGEKFDPELISGRGRNLKMLDRQRRQKRRKR